MKPHVIIIAFASLLFYSSCREDSLWLLSEVTEGVVINSSCDSDIVQIPPSVQDYVAEHFNGLAIINVEVEDDGYVVVLNNGSELFFNSTGTYIGQTEVSGSDIPINNLPAEVINFINEHYPNDGIERVKQESNGTYEIRLLSGIRLLFSQDWQFLYTISNNHIPIEEIPQTIVDYLAAAYPNINLDEAEYDPSSDVYKIELSNEVELYFDASGSLLYQEDNQGEWWENDNDNDVEILLSQLPEIITTYLQTNYPDAAILKAEIEESGDYEIRLSNGLKIYFNSSGNFLYIETEYQLSISSLSFPDTVTIGDIVLLNGYILNNAPTPFNGNELEVVFGIEDTPPGDLIIATEDGAENIGVVSIAPQDSIAFSIPIAVTAARFNVGFDIAVVWPDVPTSINPVIIGGGRNAVETFVKTP